MPAGTIPKIAWPMVVETGVNDILIVNEAGLGDLTCTIPNGTYFWRGDGSGNDMAAVFQTALNNIPGSGNGYSVTFYNAAVGAVSAGAMEVDTDTLICTFKWTSGSTTADANWFGETGLADIVYAVGATDSTQQCYRVWLPEQIYIDDSEDRPFYLAEQQIMADGSTSAQQWGERFERTVFFDVLPAWKVFEGDEVYVGEAWYQQTAGGERPSTLVSQGLRFEFTPSVSVPGTYETYVPSGRTFMRHQDMSTSAGMVRRYDLTLPMIRFV